MRALIQRVSWAEVEVDGRIIGQIQKGLLVYLGITSTDTPRDARNLADKVVNLRIFTDDEGKLNRSLRDVRGGVLEISNFTLMADARKGRRPAFSDAAPAPIATPLNDAFVEALRGHDIQVATGLFGADMTIRSAADGPVNIILDMPPLADTGPRRIAGGVEE